MAELTSTVHVYDEGGVVHVFGPGDTVPEWAADKITNPKLWSVEGGTPETDDENSDDENSDDENSDDENSDDENSDDENSDDENSIPIPPKGGPKATVEAWVAYAKANGFEIDGDASRKEIIEALEAENIPTE